MKVEFQALVKELKSKALVSLDKGFEVKLRGEDPNMGLLAFAPAGTTAKITIEWKDETEGKDGPGNKAGGQAAVILNPRGTRPQGR